MVTEIRTFKIVDRYITIVLDFGKIFNRFSRLKRAQQLKKVIKYAH